MKKYINDVSLRFYYFFLFFFIINIIKGLQYDKGSLQESLFKNFDIKKEKDSIVEEFIYKFRDKNLVKKDDNLEKNKVLENFKNYEKENLLKSENLVEKEGKINMKLNSFLIKYKINLKDNQNKNYEEKENIMGKNKTIDYNNKLINSDFTENIFEKNKEIYSKENQNDKFIKGYYENYENTDKKNSSEKININYENTENKYYENISKNFEINKIEDKFHTSKVLEDFGQKILKQNNESVDFNFQEKEMEIEKNPKEKEINFTKNKKQYFNYLPENLKNILNSPSEKSELIKLIKPSYRVKKEIQDLIFDKYLDSKIYLTITENPNTEKVKNIRNIEGVNARINLTPDGLQVSFINNPQDTQELVKSYINEYALLKDEETLNYAFDFRLLENCKEVIFNNKNFDNYKSKNLNSFNNMFLNNIDHEDPDDNDKENNYEEKDFENEFMLLNNFNFYLKLNLNFKKIEDKNLKMRKFLNNYNSNTEEINNINNKNVSNSEFFDKINKRKFSLQEENNKILTIFIKINFNHKNKNGKIFLNFFNNLNARYINDDVENRKSEKIKFSSFIENEESKIEYLENLEENLVDYFNRNINSTLNYEEAKKEYDKLNIKIKNLYKFSGENDKLTNNSLDFNTLIEEILNNKEKEDDQNFNNYKKNSEKKINIINSKIIEKKNLQEKSNKVENLDKIKVKRNSFTDDETNNYKQNTDYQINSLENEFKEYTIKEKKLLFLKYINTIIYQSCEDKKTKSNLMKRKLRDLLEENLSVSKKISESKKELQKLQNKNSTLSNMYKESEKFNSHEDSFKNIELNQINHYKNIIIRLDKSFIRDFKLIQLEKNKLENKLIELENQRNLFNITQKNKIKKQSEIEILDFNSKNYKNKIIKFQTDLLDNENLLSMIKNNKHEIEQKMIYRKNKILYNENFIKNVKIQIKNLIIEKDKIIVETIENISKKNKILKEIESDNNSISEIDKKIQELLNQKNFILKNLDEKNENLEKLENKNSIKENRLILINSDLDYLNNNLKEKYKVKENTSKNLNLSLIDLEKIDKKYHLFSDHKKKLNESVYNSTISINKMNEKISLLEKELNYFFLDQETTRKKIIDLLEEINSIKENFNKYNNNFQNNQINKKNFQLEIKNIIDNLIKKRVLKDDKYYDYLSNIEYNEEITLKNNKNKKNSTNFDYNFYISEKNNIYKKNFKFYKNIFFKNISDYKNSTNSNYNYTSRKNKTSQNSDEYSEIEYLDIFKKGLEEINFLEDFIVIDYNKLYRRINEYQSDARKNLRKSNDKENNLTLAENNSKEKKTNEPIFGFSEEYTFEIEKINDSINQNKKEIEVYKSKIKKIKDNFQKITKNMKNDIFSNIKIIIDFIEMEYKQNNFNINNYNTINTIIDILN